MTKAIQLTARDVEHIHDPYEDQPRGKPIMMRFRKESADNDKPWNTMTIANGIQALTERRRPRSFEIWCSNNQSGIVLWEQQENDTKPLYNQWKTFNPFVERVPIPYYFPPLRQNAYVRVGRVRPWRNPHQPIEHRFGLLSGRKVVESPIVNLINSIPIEDGITTVVQVLWRQNFLWWRLNPMNHMEGPWGHAYDAKLMEAKAKARQTWYADIRILEIIESKRLLDRNACGAAGHGFGAYRADRGNDLRYDSLKGFGNADVVEWVRAMRFRRLKHKMMHGPTRPHFSAEEMAGLIHPIPPGLKVPNFVYSGVASQDASASQKIQGENLLDALKKNEKVDVGGAHGIPRQLNRGDITTALSRRRES